ncbi:MAG TPA: OmpA family protein [Saprospiraceae bacterium]|nr:OmpA family protein [Saprospiraceae bacterium]
MLKRFILARVIGVLITALLPATALPQTLADTIRLGNPSFEDIPHAGGPGYPFPIVGWLDCGRTRFPNETPPDIHPASAWEVTKPPQHGTTYLGMVVRDDETWESLSQAFSAPLKAGECYALSLWLSRSERYLSVRRHDADSLYPFDRPAVLRIWGGKSFCDEGELLAVSEPVNDYAWKKYTFKLEPVMDHRFITLQAFYKTPVLNPYNGHVLVDNISPIIRMSCGENDAVKVLENTKVTQPVNSKPTPTSRPGNSSPTKSQNINSIPPVVTTEAPKLLTELERNNLHQGKTIRIEKLYFKADSSRIQYESYPVLEEIAQFMRLNPDIIIEIGGHTNTKPSHSYCDELSTARAKSVMDYLISKGVPRLQLQYKGYGKNKPLVPNDTYSRTAQAKNQRVEIKILSLGVR